MPIVSRHLSSARAPNNPGHARFKHTPTGQPSSREKAALSTANDAVVEGRSVHPKSVRDASEANAVLVSGMNNSKIGATCEVGAWAGMPIFYVTLEERATCPVSCWLWSECYGNALPMARRINYNEGFILSLQAELDYLAWANPRGFIVRLHMLGDFPEIGYLRWWHERLREYPGLRIWGYTAHQEGTPIGDATWALNHEMAGRVAIRNSVKIDAEPDSWQVTTVWDPIEGRRAGGGVICPAEFPRPNPVTCGRCGLCWKSEVGKMRITFLGHGMNRPDSAHRKKFALPTLPPASPLAKFLPRPDRASSDLDKMVEAAIAAGQRTVLPLRRTPKHVKVRD